MGKLTSQENRAVLFSNILLNFKFHIFRSFALCANLGPLGVAQRIPNQGQEQVYFAQAKLVYLPIFGVLAHVS